jgi:hypothetical protein
MTTSETPSKGSKIKDLVVTAAVASVVSALVYPWMRRWLDPITSGMGPPQPATPPAGLPTDEFEARLARLLEVPDPFAPELRRERSRTTTRRNESDADDDDPEP